MNPSKYKVPKKNKTIFEISKFFTYLVQNSSLNKNSKSNYLKLAALNRSFRGIEELLTSFSKVRKFEDQNFEWNPFAQYPIFHRWDISQTEDLMHDFSKVQAVISEFLEIVHESIHVLTLEPFFVGEVRQVDFEKFLDMCLAFEGFAFWYADIIATKSLRISLPDGEFTFARRSVSQMEFHPYRAFLALGISKNDQVLDIYLNAFRGYKTALFEKSDDFYTAKLNQRILSFYRITKKPVKLLYSKLKDIGYFSEFQKRFCQIDGLPSVMTKNQLSLFEKNIFRYCKNLAKSQFNYLAKMNSSELNRIKVRRALQVRAYYGLCIKYALKKKLVYSLKEMKEVHSPVLLFHVENYLCEIEKLLFRLASDPSEVGLEKDVIKIDIDFDRHINRVLKKTRAVMAARDIMLEMSPQRRRISGKGRFGLVLPHLQTTPKLLSEQLDWIMGVLSEKMSTTDIKKKKAVKTAIEAAINLERQLRQKVKSKNRSNLEKVELKICRDWNRLILSPIVFESWSCYVDQIRPVRNEFREILFIYE